MRKDGAGLWSISSIMMRHVLWISALAIASSASAQVYPESNAVWCLRNGISPGGLEYTIQMGHNPDTLINGVVYKRIWDGGVPDVWYEPPFFVRNGIDGKGYAYLPETGEEYLTVDLAAAVGDTVHDVLVYNAGDCCCPDGFMTQVTVVVDSIKTISNAGVTVVRHFVHVPCYPFTFYSPRDFFWQGGIGTSHGPFLHLSNSFAEILPRCITVGDTSYFADWSSPYGLPGTAICCLPNYSEIDEDASRAVVIVQPNPSAGLFRFIRAEAPTITVFDASGRRLFSTGSSEVDLGAYPPGCYHAFIATASGVANRPLVVMR